MFVRCSISSASAISRIATRSCLNSCVTSIRCFTRTAIHYNNPTSSSNISSSSSKSSSGLSEGELLGPRPTSEATKKAYSGTENLQAPPTYSPSVIDAIRQENANTVAGNVLSISNETSQNGKIRTDEKSIKDMNDAYVRHTSISGEQVVYKPSVDLKGEYVLPHPLWHGEYIDAVKFWHLVPQNFTDKLAYWTIRAMRFNFDWMSGYMFGQKTMSKMLTRCIFLETVAGVPGSIGGVVRHLASLRRMQRDGGWIHTLLEEAENERMHLLTFIALKKPGRFMRSMVFVTQGVFFNFYWMAYLINPRFCHRLVGYLEEQAVLTYSTCLQEIDNGNFKAWQTQPAPEVAIKYWNLPSTATVRDVIAVIRADEAHHRDVNHVFGNMKTTELNPFKPGH